MRKVGYDVVDVLGAYAQAYGRLVDALLEHALGGIGEAAIDVARVAQPEAVGSVL